MKCPLWNIRNFQDCITGRGRSRFEDKLIYDFSLSYNISHMDILLFKAYGKEPRTVSLLNQLPSECAELLRAKPH